MRLGGGALLVLAVLASMPARGSVADKIRVHLKAVNDSISIRGMGMQIDGVAVATHSLAIPQLEKLEFTWDGERSLWQVEKSGKAKPVELKQRRIRISGSMMQANVKLVPSPIELMPVGEKIRIIGELDIEEYLLGVLPSEMPAAWPIEALKAQAVASRTYARYIMSQRQKADYHVESTIHDQVYSLLNHLGNQKQYQDKIETAIDKTRGLYLQAEDTTPFAAFYHADCGGQTEEPFRVWKNGVKNGTVVDPSCPLSPHGEWDRHYDQPWLANKLRTHFGFDPATKFTSLNVAKRTPTGRVGWLEVRFKDQQTKKLTAHEFRRLLGFTKIKSTNFWLNWKGQKLVVHGRGHGHGVGMCQWGARHLALRGMNFREILRHYYPLAKLSDEVNVSEPIEWQPFKALAL